MYRILDTCSPPPFVEGNGSKEAAGEGEET